MKNAAAYDRLINEGGEGYSLSEDRKAEKLNAEIALKAKRLETEPTVSISGEKYLLEDLEYQLAEHKAADTSMWSEAQITSHHKWISLYERAAAHLKSKQ